MQWVGFPELAFHIARKDWAEARLVVLGLTLGLGGAAACGKYGPPVRPKHATPETRTSEPEVADEAREPEPDEPEPDEPEEEVAP